MARRFSGDSLRAIRVNADVRAEQLALDVGRSVYTIAGYELGTITPPSDVVGKIADRFGVSIDDLYADTEATVLAAA